MPLELRNPESSDLPDGGQSWRPTTREEVWFPLGFEVGERGDPRADLFYVTVATPEAIRERRHCGGRATDTKLLIVEGEYSWETVIRELGRIVESCDEGNWVHSVERLSERFHWEYENYKG